MANISISKLVLRCYGHRLDSGDWYGVCLDLNIAVEAESLESLKEKLADTIYSYIEAVTDTDNHNSIPELLSRKAPIKDWLIYYGIKAIVSFRDFKDKLVFNEFIPFHLANEC